MANHCYNYCVVTGENWQLNGLYHLLSSNFLGDDKGKSSGVLDLLSIRGEPEKCIYETCGTKWFDMSLDLEDGVLYIYGDTAWSPALNLFAHISKSFNTLNFEYEYDEPGCDFGGCAEISNGVIEDNCMGYWEYKFKRDYDFALETLDEELRMMANGMGIEEASTHSARAYVDEDDFNDIIKSIKDDKKRDGVLD